MTETPPCWPYIELKKETESIRQLMEERRWANAKALDLADSLLKEKLVEGSIETKRGTQMVRRHNRRSHYRYRLRGGVWNNLVLGEQGVIVWRPFSKSRRD